MINGGEIGRCLSRRIESSDIEGESMTALMKARGKDRPFFEVVTWNQATSIAALRRMLSLPGPMIELCDRRTEIIQRGRLIDMRYDADKHSLKIKTQGLCIRRHGVWFKTSNGRELDLKIPPCAHPPLAFIGGCLLFTIGHMDFVMLPRCDKTVLAD